MGDPDARAGDRAAFDAEVREVLAAGDRHRAAEVALTAFGAEVLGYLFVVLRSEQDANDVFAEVCAQVWRDLPAFRWQSSLRTWIYAIARHRVLDHRDALARRARQIPLSEASDVGAMIARVRTGTASYLRTDVKERVATARAALDPDDQTLLVLRLDRDMSWSDVALVLGVPPATVRKRYERVKARLRNLLAR